MLANGDHQQPIRAIRIVKVFGLLTTLLACDAQESPLLIRDGG